MKLIKSKIIDTILEELEGYKFTTQEFISKLKNKAPNTYKKIIKEYGIGGKGTGNYYSSNVHIAKSLSKHKGERIVSFLEYITAPKSWGNPVIALWESNPNDTETVRINTSVEEDISELINNDKIDNTEKEALILSRVGQGKFRKKLIEYWKGCAVTSCKDIHLLVASHIKPWSVCYNEERMDVYNGLLLTPNLDRLFDKGIITFSNTGKIMISSFISNKSKRIFGIRSEMEIDLDKRHQRYMEYHCENVFETKAKNT